jgi:hypothetical protein
MINELKILTKKLASLFNSKKEEVCKYVDNGRCFIDDMTDKVECTGMGHDLKHCGDYQAYKSMEEK